MLASSLRSYTTPLPLGNRGGGNRCATSPSPSGTQPRFRAPRRAASSTGVTGTRAAWRATTSFRRRSTSRLHVGAHGAALRRPRFLAVQRLAPTWAQARRCPATNSSPVQQLAPTGRSRGVPPRQPRPTPFNSSHPRGGSRHGPATTSLPRRSTSRSHVGAEDDACCPRTRGRCTRDAARHRPTPSCARAGVAGARGHPRAQAEGRARGTHGAATTRGHRLRLGRLGGLPPGLRFRRCGLRGLGRLPRAPIRPRSSWRRWRRCLRKERRSAPEARSEVRQMGRADHSYAFAELAHEQGDLGQGGGERELAQGAAHVRLDEIEGG
jgi:hypothetical protein